MNRSRPMRTWVVFVVFALASHTWAGNPTTRQAVKLNLVNAPELLDSPRLAALAKTIDAGDANALERFWADMQGHAPLVEPFPCDASSWWVTFLFRGDAKTRTVLMLGGPWAISTDGRGMNLLRLRDTDLWYRSMRVPNDARFVYDYRVNLSGRLPDNRKVLGKLYAANASADPLNAQFIEPGIFGRMSSVLEMPDAPPQPYIHPIDGTPHGTITKHKIESGILKKERTYAIYTPPGYDQKGEPLLADRHVRRRLLLQAQPDSRRHDHRQPDRREEDPADRRRVRRSDRPAEGSRLLEGLRRVRER